MSEPVAGRFGAIEQCCWTHEAREAVCRCPSCGHCFCRECVTEHESRLLCAACLATQDRSGSRGRARTRSLVPFLLAVAGVILTWAVFLAAAESLLTFAERSDRSAWQQR